MSDSPPSSPAFAQFLRDIASSRDHVREILACTTSADDLSEASMVLVFQGLFDALLSSADSHERLKLASTLKDLLTALNTRRDIARKALASAEKSATPALDAESTAELQARLKLL